MNSNQTNATFNKLMQRPDIDQATQRYEEMIDATKKSLSKQIPNLSHWKQHGAMSESACDQKSYPGSDVDGAVRYLPQHIAPATVTDAEYAKALSVIGAVAQKFGFDSKPQRVQDGHGAHYAAFHNVHDDGRIDVNVSEKKTGIATNVGCYRTAEAKKRGHPSES